MHAGHPIFLRISVDRLGIDANAVRRGHGLELMMGGNVLLASVMGPDEDLAKVIDGQHDMLIRGSCAEKPLPPYFWLGESLEVLLRGESPVQTRTRRFAEVVCWGSHTFRQGDIVMLALRATNRYPESFRDPDRLDRPDIRSRRSAPDRGRLDGAIDAMRADGAGPPVLTRSTTLTTGRRRRCWSRHDSCG